MAELLILSFLVGAVLGQRYRVLVLVPLTLIMGCVAIAVGVVIQIAVFDALKDLVFCALALQAGYLFGSVVRFWLAASRASRLFARPLKTAR